MEHDPYKLVEEVIELAYNLSKMKATEIRLIAGNIVHPASESINESLASVRGSSIPELVKMILEEEFLEEASNAREFLQSELYELKEFRDAEDSVH